MTDNQEKELFIILNALVTDVKGIRATQTEHSQILEKHSQVLEKHSQILEKHSQILGKHSQILERLDAKTDTIAGEVLKQNKRLSVVEKDVVDLRGGVH